ncbi:MAG: hypothetical protein IPN76_03040 [Saprospiraceae bacterium]|nr:hypothetical protein [Saprospiraceae bacterium]
MLQEHYQEGKHGGSAWPVVLGVFFVLLLLSILVIFIIVKSFSWVAHLIG